MTQVFTLRPWRTHPRETIALSAIGAAALLVLAGVSGATPALPKLEGSEALATPVAPPAPPPMAVRDLDPQTALQINAQIPVTGKPGAAAAPFILGKALPEARARALECLTSAVYYEAAQESDAGQRGVAQVVLNRVRHPAFPNSVCGVVYEGSTRPTGCQFTFTCDGSMEHRPIPALWNRARGVANAMLSGAVYAPVGQATHYHANYVVPYWASSLAKTHVEGAHIFYRWAGNWGRPSAFGQSWAGREGNPSALRIAALSVPHTPATTKPIGTVAALQAAGAKVTEDGGRVRVLFSPQAREAVEKVKVTPYVDRVPTSDNLRYALGDGAQAANQPAFGKNSEPAAAKQ